MDRASYRWGSIAALLGGVLALVGNLLHPRYDGADEDVYDLIASSTKLPVADVILLVAIALVVAGFIAIGRANSGPGRGPAGEYGGLAALVGGGVAIAQFGVELFAYRQQAKVMVDRDAYDGAEFWATNAVDHLNSALFDVWIILLLGAAPVLLGVAMLYSRRYGPWIPLAGIVGGVNCLFVGFVNLLRTDQTDTNTAFWVGSLLVTVWLLAAGVELWREGQRTQPARAG